MHTYTAYGLRLESEIEFPELAGTEAIPLYDPAPISIRRGDVPRDLPNSITTVEGYRVTKDEALLILDGTARFQITEGRSITFAPEHGYEPSWLRIVLLSGALGILLHQRRLLPLHASAVVSEGTCIAFCGNTGAGKSTLAAGLSTGGLKLMAEDKLIVRHTGSEWMAWPAIPILHLLEESAKHSGLNFNTRASTSPRMGKYVYLDYQRFQRAPIPLKVIYLIDWSPQGSKATIARLSTTEAFFNLRMHASLHGLLPAMGHESLFLQWATNLLKDVPVFRFSRPQDYTQLAAGLTSLCDHWTSLK
jgi:hypothetical protein